VTQKALPSTCITRLLAVRLAQQALSTPGHLPTVSIICPYRAQVNLIERLLRLEELDELVRVGTIHRFQGRESDVVIFDTVTTENAARSMLGWAYDDAAPHKLINVALTRAKGKLIVIGHHGALATLQHGPQPILWECIEEAKANGLHLAATAILPAMTFSLHDSPIDSDASPVTGDCTYRRFTQDSSNPCPHGSHAPRPSLLTSATPPRTTAAALFGGSMTTSGVRRLRTSNNLKGWSIEFSPPHIQQEDPHGHLTHSSPAHLR
jgi:hypothetical protein